MPDRILLQDEFDLFTIHENLSQVLPNLSEFAVRTKKPRRALKNYSFFVGSAIHFNHLCQCLKSIRNKLLHYHHKINLASYT
jgi:hypothetical protein